MAVSITIPIATGSVESLNTMRVNVQDYGAIADNGTTDCSIAFEAAYTALSAYLNANNGLRGEIYWPGATQPYTISRPMMITDPYVWIVGDGPSSRIENRTGGPCVLFGIRETETIAGPATLALDSSYRPDIFGKLDTSVATGTGQRWGLRTKNDATVIFSHCPLDLGVPDAENFSLDGWGTISKLTIEFAVEPGTGSTWPGGGSGGFWMLGGYDDTKSICSLIRGGGTNQFDLQITDSAGLNGFATIQNVSGSGTQKLCWQIDLSGSTPTCIGFADGVQTSVNLTGALWSASGARTFWTNDYSPFIIGANTSVSDNRAPSNVVAGSTGMDCNIYGLQFYKGTPYANDGVGQAQRRSDSGTLNDNYRFGQGGKTDNLILFQLYRTDSPITDPTKRRVTAYSGTSGGFILGWMMQCGMYSTQGGIIGNGLQDLQLVGRGNKFQSVVEVGAVLDLVIKRCVISNGTYAIANLNILANYSNAIEDCDLSGSQGCVYLAWTDTRIKNCKFSNMGRCAVRAWASNSYLDDCRGAQFNSNADYCYKVHQGAYGSITEIRRYLVDAEGGSCNIATLGFEHFPDQPTSVVVDGIYIGSTADGKSIIELLGKTSPTTVAKIDAKRIFPASATVGWTYAARITKTSWTGSIQINSSSGFTLNNVDGQTAVTAGA